MVAFMLAGTVYSLVVVHGLADVVSRAAAIHNLGRITTSSSEMVGLDRALVLYSIFDDKALVEQYRGQFESTTKTFGQLLN